LLPLSSVIVRADFKMMILSASMEFYVTQNANGIRYNFGAQCDLAGAHAWHVGQHWLALGGISGDMPNPCG
jgi:hypothetical protein